MNCSTFSLILIASSVWRSLSPKSSSMVISNLGNVCFLKRPLMYENSFALPSLWSLQSKRKWWGVSLMLQVEHSNGVSGSILCLWPLSIEWPVFNLTILEMPFLEVFFKSTVLNLRFLGVILGTIFLYMLLLEFSQRLAHLFIDSNLLPYFISEEETSVFGGMCLAFLDPVFASESASSFSLIPWCAGQ